MPVPFNIELKQDDAQRVIELNGVPTRFYASAEEFNKITSMIAYLLGQESQLYKGEFDYIEEIEAAYPLSEPGSTASLKVDAGDDIHVRWDNTSKKWVKDGLVKDNQPGVISMAENIRAVLEASGTKYYGTKNGVPGVFDFPQLSTGDTNEYPTTQSGIISFASGYQGGMTFQPRAAWKFLGESFGSTAAPITQEITLNAADATYGRYDVIALEDTGNIVVIQGEPSATPEKPIIDIDTQLEATFFFIPANAASPDGVSNTVIYDEGAAGEATITIHLGSARINTASANTPSNGNQCIEATNLENRDNFSFTLPEPVLRGEVKELLFDIKNKVVPTSSVTPIRISVRGELADGSIGMYPLDIITAYGWDVKDISNYQAIALPIDQPTLTKILGFKFYNFGQTSENIGFFLDNIRYTSGVSADLSQFASKDEVEAAKQEAIAEAEAHSDANRADLEVQIDAVEEDLLNHESRIVALESGDGSGTGGTTSNEEIGIVPTGVIDGTNKIFTLPSAYVTGKIKVYRNGIRQTPTDDFVEVSTTAIEFVEAPVVDGAGAEKILIDYYPQS
jgi:hypothetical protein